MGDRRSGATSCGGDEGPAALGDDEPAIKSRLEAAEQAVSALARLTEDLDVAKLRAEGPGQRVPRRPRCTRSGRG